MRAAATRLVAFSENKTDFVVDVIAGVDVHATVIDDVLVHLHATVDVVDPDLPGASTFAVACTCTWHVDVCGGGNVDVAAHVDVLLF